MLRKTYQNPRFPHQVTITRLQVDDNPFSETGDTVTTLYSGVGRAFTDTTTNGSNQMDNNRRKCSIPVRYDHWGMEILDGDKISVTIGEITYDGIVKDFEPDNNRSLIYWERNRV